MVSSPALDVFQQVTERGWYELPTHGPEASSWSLCSNPHMWKRGLYLLGKLTQMKPDCLSLGLCDGVPGITGMIVSSGYHTEM